jgi:hypothetical protein
MYNVQQQNHHEIWERRSVVLALSVPPPRVIYPQRINMKLDIGKKEDSEQSGLRKE